MTIAQALAIEARFSVPQNGRCYRLEGEGMALRYHAAHLREVCVRIGVAPPVTLVVFPKW